MKHTSKRTKTIGYLVQAKDELDAALKTARKGGDLLASAIAAQRGRAWLDRLIDMNGEQGDLFDERTAPPQPEAEATTLGGHPLLVAGWPEGRPVEDEDEDGDTIDGEAVEVGAGEEGE